MTLLPKNIIIIRGIIGCIAIFAYFLISANLEMNDLIRQELSRDEALELAITEFNNSDLGNLDLKQQVSVEINDDLFTYGQTKLNNKLPQEFYPVSSWLIEWTGEVETKEDMQEASFRVEYDFDGNLIRLEQDMPNLRRPPNYKEEAALRAALIYIYRQNVDTTNLALTNKINNSNGQVLNYDFTFSKESPISSDLRQSYNIQISGRNITNYTARLLFEWEDVVIPQVHKTAKRVSLIIVLVLWTTISFFVFSTFIKKLKNSELEFKRAIGAGIFVALTMWCIVAISSWPDWIGILLGGGVAAVLSGLAMVITYAATDSKTREVWPEKLGLTDIFFRGYIIVSEFGRALLNSLFFSGITLIFFAGLFWFVNKSSLGYIRSGEDMVLLFQDDLSGLRAILKNILSSLFITGILLSFWSTYLKSKIKNKTVLTLTIALFLNLAGLNLYFISPSYVAFILFLPLAYIWAKFILDEDITAVIISLITIHIFLGLALISHLPNPFLNTPALLSSFFISGLLGFGIFSLVSTRSVKEFQHYIPDYVGKIAERERFLKELEIARSVQSRFLPQTLPTFSTLDIACICKPAKEIGGDYYDFIINRAKNTLSVIIGDVSGKGVSAAFYMTMAKGIIKTLTKTISNPKRILSEMNGIFFDNVPNEIFISVIYGEFDIDNKILRFARAGHNPLIIHKNGTSEAELILPKGLAIGLDSGGLFANTIEEVEIPIEKGDIFTFYTDGVSESLNRNGEEFGEERLQQTICENCDDSAQSILDNVNKKILQFAGATKQHDDLTMVVVKIQDC